MNSLHPTVWRTCRVISNEIRLKLLWRLFQLGNASMGQLAQSVEVSEPTASSGLRALNARGLIRSERRGLYVFYTPYANPAVTHSDAILSALRACYDDVVSFEHVIHVATAFTHPRRIEIVKALKEGALGEVELSIRTQISMPALYRHLRKLNDRGFIQKTDKCYVLLEQTAALSRALLAAAIR